MEEKELIQFMKDILVNYPKIENKLPEVLTEDEIKRLISSVNLDSEFGQRNKTIIEVLYGTGIRVSELIEIKLSNIFFKENILKCPSKSTFDTGPAEATPPGLKT